MITEYPSYYRRDEKDGITPPDLGKESTIVEHIVHARGKRSSFTSVSLDRSKITDFGPQLYRLDAPQLIGDEHQLIEHRSLLESLREIISASSKAEKAQALQAQRYAVRRKEGLIKWTFNTGSIERKDLIQWAFNHVQKYFSRS